MKAPATLARRNRQSAMLLARSVLRHASIRPLADQATPAGTRDGAHAPDLGHDFSQVPARTDGPASCSVTPTRCPFGGACHACPLPVQAKLAVNRPGDRYEQEADQAAEEVTHTEGGQLQRHSTGQAGLAHVPPIVHDVLRSPGRPLDEQTRASIEPRFGHDLGHVRVRVDARAAASADAVNALAYTVGRDVVFGKGQYAPHTAAGRLLLAHELVHVLQQQNSSGLQRNVLRRKGGTFGGFFRNLGRGIASFFTGKEVDYDESTLQQYLKTLDDTNDIEDDYDSDNKARAIVRLWKRGDSAYILPVRRKILLIQEMLSGFVGNDDERAILDLLSGSTDAELSTILVRIGRATLNAAFHWEEQTRLDRLLATRPDREQSSRGQGQPRTSEASTEIFEAETILEAQRRFTSNAELGRQVRLNCIEIVRQMAPQLLRDDPRLASRVSRGLSRLRGATLTMEHAGNVLTRLGAATGPVEIRFNNGNGNREPTAMTSSAWDTIIDMVGNAQGWHVFGLAVFDGYHSVTVLVDNRPDGPRVYWADQWAIDPGEDFDQEVGSVSGFRRYERAGLDKFIENYTISRWNHVHSPNSKCGKAHPRNWDRACRYTTSLLIWKFRSRRPTSG